MSVYYKENPYYLKDSIESMIRQTKVTDDFVLVCDGPLSKDLDTIISFYENRYPDIFHIVRLSQNSGLGNALRIGLPICKNELIARMDSDDISLSTRCEQQLNHFNTVPNCDVLSGTIAEFDDIYQNVKSYKKLPLAHSEIIEYSRYRSPINHPCVMYKKTKVLEAGNYQDFPFLEDYYLWIRMICNGSIFNNLPDLLLYMRAGQNMYERRGGAKYIKLRISFSYMLYTKAFISLGDFFVLVGGQIIIGIIPNTLRKKFYYRFLRTYKL